MTALAVASTEHLGPQLPLWSIVPFGVMLLSIAFLPIRAGGLWEYNRNKAFLSLLLGAPVAAWTATLHPAPGLHPAGEALAFILLLGALFVISGGIVVRGTLAGTPGLNSIVLAI